LIKYVLTASTVRSRYIILLHMSFPPEFCSHTMRDWDEVRDLRESFQKKDQQLEDELIQKAGGIITPLLKDSGPIQYSNFVSLVSKELGFEDNEEVPYGIKLAVLTAWHGGVFDVASDRTITLKPQKDCSKRRR